MGGLSHYIDGAVFALIFAVAVSPLLPLPATRAGNLVKALIFSTILALLIVVAGTRQRHRLPAPGPERTRRGRGADGRPGPAGQS